MSSYKPVTSAQAECLRKMAIEKGISRALFQSALDGGQFARYLDSLKKNPLKKDCDSVRYIPFSRFRIAEIERKAASEGARIYVIRRVHILQDREWQEVINQGGPNTPSDYIVRKPEVSAMYPPICQASGVKDIILLNYPKAGQHWGEDGGWEKAIAFGKSTSMVVTNPREVSAIGEQNPNLHNILGQDPVFVASTTECRFGAKRQVFYVCWAGFGRRVRLGSFDSLNTSSDWFAFSN